MEASEKTNAAKSEPPTAFPWRGFYGGSVRRIVIDYSDMSSSVIGLDGCASLENANTDLRSALSELLSWCKGYESSILNEMARPYIERAEAALKATSSDLRASPTEEPALPTQGEAASPAPASEER